MSTATARSPSRPLPTDRPAEAVGLVLDLENLLHGARHVSGEAVRHGLVRFLGATASLGPRHFAVGACDWWLAKVLAPTVAALGLRVFPGPCGQDRADHDLLRRARDLPASVDLLVIGSGDGAFAPLAREQRAGGRRVVVAARPGTVSVELRYAADHVLLVEIEGTLRRAA